MHVITIASSWPITKRERCKLVVFLVVCIPSVWVELLWIAEVLRIPTHGIDWYHNGSLSHAGRQEEREGARGKNMERKRESTLFYQVILSNHFAL